MEFVGPQPGHCQAHQDSFRSLLKLKDGVPPQKLWSGRSGWSQALFSECSTDSSDQPLRLKITPFRQHFPECGRCVLASESGEPVKMQILGPSQAYLF